MTMNLQFFLILLVLISYIVIFVTLHNRSLSMGHGTIWILINTALLVFAIFPRMIIEIATSLGFEAPSNMVFLLGFYFLYSITFVLLIHISTLENKIRLLVQEVSILKKEVSHHDEKD